jgi:VanZ family protein
MKQTERQGKRTAAAAAIRSLAPLSWMAVIYWFSSREGDDLNAMLPFFQRFLPGMESFDWGHLVSYYILALLMEYAAGRSSQRLGIKAVIVLLCILYGVTDEYHQSFVGGRMTDHHDLVNDGIGALLAVLTTAIPPVRRRWSKILR